MKNDKMPSTFSSPFRKIDSEDYLDQFDRRKLILGLQRHAFIILVCMAFCTCLATWVTYRFLTTYKAEAVLIFQEDAIRSLNLNGLSMSKFTLPTVLDMIKIPSNYQAIRQALGLDLSLDQIEGMTEVPLPKNNSNLIRVIAKGNQGVVVDMANALAKSAVKSSQEFARKQIQDSLNSFQKELQRNKHQASLQLQEIEEFKEKHNYLEMTPENRVLLSQMSAARSKLENIQLQYSGLLVEYANLKHAVENLPNQVPSGLEAAKTIRESALESKILALEGSLAEAKSRYAEGNPKIARLEEELQSLLIRSQQKKDPQNIVDQAGLVRNMTKERLETSLLLMQSKVQATEKMLEDMENTVAALQKKTEKLPAQQIAFIKLLEGKQILDAQTKLLTTAVESAKVFLNSPLGTLDLYQIATKASPLRDSPTIKILPVLGLLFGAFMGLILSYFLEIKDRKIRTPKEIALKYTSPCLVAIPEIHFLNVQNGEEKTLFYIRELANRLEQSFTDSSSLIALTSSLRKEGKTLLSTFLAFYFKTLNKKTLFVSFDTALNPFFEEPFNAGSITSYLRGEASFDEILQEGQVDRVALLEREKGMKELVKKVSMDEFWEEARNRYEVIVIDAPSIIDEDYGVDILKKVDFPLLVVNSSKTNKSIIDQSLSYLASFEVVPSGIILNRILPTYIEDVKVKKEMKKERTKLFQSLFSKKGHP